MQFRVDAFNMLNHPNFGSIDNFLGDETFGEPTTMANGQYYGLSSLYQIGGPRSLQLSMRFSF
jgi:hypothetical protein